MGTSAPFFLPRRDPSAGRFMTLVSTRVGLLDLLRGVSLNRRTPATNACGKSIDESDGYLKMTLAPVMEPH